MCVGHSMSVVSENLCFEITNNMSGTYKKVKTLCLVSS